MDIIENTIDELTREFKVTVPAAEIEKKFDSRLRKLAQTAKMPGFRPGKVPLPLLRKLYGDSVRGEAVEETVNETVRTVVSERGLRPALPPRIADASFAEAGDLTCTIAVELLPEVSPPDYGAIELERVVAEVEDEQVDKTLERLSRAYGTASVVEEERGAQEGDIAVVDIVGPEDRKLFVGKDGENVAINLSPEGDFADFAKQLIGAKVGDRVRATARFPETFRVPELAGGSETYEVLIKELKVHQPAPIDDGLAQRFGLNDLAALREKIRAEHESELKSASRLRLKRSLLDRLAALYAFPVPQGLVQREYESIVKQLNPEGEQAGVAPPPSVVAHDHDHHHDHDHDHDPHHAHDHDHDHHGPTHGEVGHVHGLECAHEHGEEHDHPVAAAIDANLTEAERQEYRQLAERRVRLGLVLAEVSKQHNLRVTQDELSRAVVNEARRYPGQESAVVEFFRKNAQAREALAAPVLEDKVVDFMLEMAKVAERKVSVEELLRMAEDESTSVTEAASASGHASKTNVED